MLDLPSPPAHLGAVVSSMLNYGATVSTTFLLPFAPGQGQLRRPPGQPRHRQHQLDGDGGYR